MGDKSKKITDILFGVGNKPADKSFAETSAAFLAKNQYEVAKNSSGNFIESVVYEVPLSDIDIDDTRFQMRLPNNDISEVKKSIEEEGQQTPVILLKMKEQDKLIIISGFTRTRAIQELKRPIVKATIKTDMQEVDALTIAFIENEARKNLTDWERIQCFVMLLKKGKTVTQVAKDIGKDHSTVSLYQKVYDSKEPIREALKRNLINFSKANMLARYQDRLNDAQIEEVLSKATELSVQNLKNVIEEILENRTSVKTAVREEKEKPKRNNAKKRNRFAVNINFKKSGEIYKFSAKFLIAKENKDEVKSKFEEILKEIANL